MKKYILIFAAVVALFSFGCRSESEEETANSYKSNIVAPADSIVQTEPEFDATAPFKPSENPKDDLLNSTKRLQAHDAWSATLENNLMPEMKTELEYVKPDRYRIKNKVNEIVVVGSDAYGKQSGKWQKLPEDIGAQIEMMKKSFNAEGMKSITEVAKSGTEKIGDKEATIYTYSINAGANPVKNSTKVWIANETGLPLKIMVETENAAATQRVTTNYNYTKPVKIEAPQIQ